MIRIITSQPVNICSLVILLLFSGLLGGCGSLKNYFYHLHPGKQHQSLQGDWKFISAEHTPANYYAIDVDDANWRTITVPSNWYLQEVDISGGSYWYRKNFNPAETLKGKSVQLVFEGVDYTADVWLNDTYLGFHEGYFGTFTFDVTKHLKFGKNNTLAVLVKSPMEEPGVAWSLNKRQIKGVLNHHDTRPGGAWSSRGQEKNSGGIWAPVYLEATESLVIKMIRITPTISKNGDITTATASILVDYETRSRSTDSPVRWDVTIRPYNFEGGDNHFVKFSRKSYLEKGRSQENFNLNLNDPELWWPWEMGSPNIYTADIIVQRGSRTLANKTIQFGFRQIDRNRDNGQWSINGKRLFLRGTNYIGSTYLSELSEEKLLKDLLLMKDAHINAIRVHAHVTAPDFYKLCDELGLLVWQDFPLQWGYEESEEFIDQAEVQAEEMVNQLYNHPSIFAWCGHNEPPWDASWMKYKYPKYNKDQNRELDDKLFKKLQQLDSHRYNHKYSATSEHPWLGWYSGSWLDYGKATEHSLITEFGAQALPNLSTLQTFIEEKYLWPVNTNQWKIWEYHNFQSRETFQNAGVQKGESLEDFILNSQSYQERLTQFAAESYRRQRNNPVAAIFQFMFVEHWPSINWGVVDYLRTPKPGYYALQTAYQPLLPSIEYEKTHWQTEEVVTIGLWLINDLHVDWSELSIILELQDVTGETIHRQQLQASITADAIDFLGKYNWAELEDGSYELRCTVQNKADNEVAHNNYRFSVGNK